MNIKLAIENKTEDAMMRAAFTNALIDIAKQDERVCILDADLMKSIGTMAFYKEFPDRTFNCGIAEANMIGVAAGLSATGFVPYAHTFGPFASRRCFDQLFISGAYSKANIRVIGSDPGITAAYNGGTHMPFEDVGLMRTIPNITILEPVDNTMCSEIIKQLKDEYGIFYIRMMRKNPVKVYEEGSKFELGKGIVLREGKDVTIFATGILVAEALIAHEELKKEGISAEIINIFTLKPLDNALVIESAKKTGCVVTAENHNIIGGLGSAVAECLSENLPTPMVRIGAQDRFGEVGPEEYLKEVFGMRACDIVNAAKAAIAKK